LRTHPPPPLNRGAWPQNPPWKGKGGGVSQGGGLGAEETLWKMSARLRLASPTKKGIPISEETRAKMSTSKKGKNNPMFGKKNTFQPNRAGLRPWGG
jgi:hypothetical protein